MLESPIDRRARRVSLRPRFAAHIDAPSRQQKQPHVLSLLAMAEKVIIGTTLPCYGRRHVNNLETLVGAEQTNIFSLIGIQ
jgi:hypothetical protein